MSAVLAAGTFASRELRLWRHGAPAAVQVPLLA